MDEVKEWLRFAEMDYNSAEYLLNGTFHPRPYEIICYHSQQAAEKAIKALIVYYGNQGGMPKLHDVPFLMNQIHTLVKEDTGKDIPEDLLDYADNLSKYGIIPRYPNELDVDESMTKEALRQALCILEWAKGIIG